MFISLLQIGTFQITTFVLKLLEKMSYEEKMSDEESAAPFIISHGHEIKNNLKFLRMNDSFNDVKIIFNDGIVFANSVIMSSASDYFATMLNSDKFVEAQTKEVSMEEYGTKEAMGGRLHLQRQHEHGGN